MLKRTVRHITTIITCILCCWQSHAQDVHFSQFFESPLWRNPSLAGIFTGDVRVQGVYRDQWNSVTNAYRTGSLNAEIKMPVGKSEDFITTGIQMLFDRAGTIGWTSTHVLPALNYHKSLSGEHNRYLSLGFMGGVVERRFDPSKMTTNSQYNGTGTGENLANARNTYLDGSVGLSFNADMNNNPANNYYLGVAYHHFNRPNASFYRNINIELHPKWVYSAGLRMGISDNSFLTLQADHSRQGSFSETVAGAMVGLKLGADTDNPDYVLQAGTFLRWNDALIPVIKIDYAPFSVALSYDANISTLKPTSYGRGGTELSVSYTGFRKNDRSSSGFSHCPRF